MARFVILLLSFGSLALVTVWLSLQQPTFRAQREWGHKYLESQFSPYVDFSSGKLRPAASVPLKEEKVFCPCSKSYFSWTGYTTFYRISPPQAGPEGRVMRDAETLFSSKYFFQSSNFTRPDLLVAQPLVQAMVGSVIDAFDVRTELAMTNLLYPRFLSEEVAHFMQSYLYTQSIPMEALPTTNDARNYALGLYRLWRAPVDQYLLNKSSSDMDFWKLASTYPYALDVVKDRKAIGMAINWTKYMELCNPQYCEVILENGKVYRIAQAVAILGGYSTVIFVLVRKVVWPVTCKWVFQQRITIC